MIVADEREALARYAEEKPWFGAAPSALIEGLAMCPDTELHLISCVRQPVSAADIVPNRVFYHPIHVPRWAFMKSLYVPAILGIRRALKHILPSVVHGQGTERYYAMAAALSGFPNVITIHGNMRALAKQSGAPHCSFLGATALLESIALRLAGGVCANSEYTRSEVESIARRVWTVPNAIRSKFLENPPVPRAGNFHFINVGTIVSYKQQIELLNLAQDMHEQGLRFKIEFIGSASMEDGYARAFIKKVKKASEAGFASWTQHLEPAQLIERMDRSGALIHVSAEESFGLVVAEALARNLHVIAFSAGGVADILKGSPGATAVRPGDWRGLRDHLTNWIQLGCPPADSSSGMMMNRYSPNRIAALQVQVYVDAITEGR